MQRKECIHWEIVVESEVTILLLKVASLDENRVSLLAYSAILRKINDDQLKSWRN